MNLDTDITIQIMALYGLMVAVPFVIRSMIGPLHFASPEGEVSQAVPEIMVMVLLLAGGAAVVSIIDDATGDMA